MSPHELHLHWKNKQMTDEQINAAIAEVCGWTSVNAAHRSGKAPGANYVGGEFIPDYCADLNAMHEAEKSLLISKFPTYVKKLTKINFGDPITAGARERAEAFLRTLGKWEEVQK
jgi:hypothetical protein